MMKVLRISGVAALFLLPFGAAAALQQPLPGTTWESLAALPPLAGSQWVPEGVPADERAYLRVMDLPPLKGEYVAQAQKAIAAVLSGRSPVPGTTCVFDGMPRAAWYPYPLQFLYTAGFVNILQHDVVRSTPVSGLRRAPETFDPMALGGRDLYGSAVGAWQGGTLVIDTIAAREDVPTFYGIANDPDLRVTERYRLLADGRLERLTTVISPKYFTRAWNLRTTYRRAPEASWATRFCLPSSKARATTRAALPDGRSPAPAGARFTPDMTWDDILRLPGIWGQAWASTNTYDQQIVYVTNMTLVPPLKPEWQRKTDLFLERSRAGKAEFLVGACFPNGVPRSAWYAYPPGFVFRPGGTLLVTSFGETREVFMDGRGHPTRFRGDDLSTAYLGHSVGWWEGETLVIDTVGFAPYHELYYDVPNGGRMHVIERYRLTEGGRKLALTLTVEDPDRLVRPWVVERAYQVPSEKDSAMSSQGALRLYTQRCRPGMGRDQIDDRGESFVDLTPPPEGLGIGKGE